MSDQCPIASTAEHMCAVANKMGRAMGLAQAAHFIIREANAMGFIDMRLVQMTDALAERSQALMDEASREVES